MRTFLVVVGCLAFLAAVVWLQLFFWHECRMVGHSVAYCIMRR